MKRKRIIYILACLLLPTLMTSCLYENPSLTADGEMGIDPTAVTLKTNLALSFALPPVDKGQSISRPAEGETPAYRHRFVVEAYLNRELAARQVIYEDIVNGRNELSIPASMKLHARKYEIAVWSDYVQVPNEDQGITGTEEYFYNTQTNHLLTVLGSETYRGNNEYKDAFCGTTELDMTEYRDEWSAQVSLDLKLERPVARCELVANDVTAFLKRIEQGSIAGESFTVRLKYNSYLNIGYNVLNQLPRHGLMYMQYQRTIRTRDMKESTFSLAFDYLFAIGDALTRIPVTLEVVDSKNVVVAATTFNVSCQAGRYTTVTYGFLTADPDGGVNFDPGFDGKTDIEIPAAPAK